MSNFPTQVQTIQDEYYLHMIEDCAEEMYTCLRGPRPSSAILVTLEGTAVFGGVYPPYGSPSCKDEGKCMIVDGHCVRNIHAEVNAILDCASIGISTKGSTLYSVNKPCYNCTIAAINAGISRIVYRHAVYDEERTQNAINNAGIECIKLGE